MNPETKFFANLAFILSGVIIFLILLCLFCAFWCWKQKREAEKKEARGFFSRIFGRSQKSGNARGNFDNIINMFSQDSSKKKKEKKAKTEISESDSSSSSSASTPKNKRGAKRSSDSFRLDHLLKTIGS